MQFCPRKCSARVDRLLVEIPPAHAHTRWTKYLAGDLHTPSDAIEGDEFLVIDVGADDQHCHAEGVELFEAGADDRITGGPEGVGLDLLEWGQAGLAGGPNQRQQARPIPEGFAAGEVDAHGLVVFCGQLVEAAPDLQGVGDGHPAVVSRTAVDVAERAPGVAPICQQQAGKIPHGEPGVR